MVKTFKAVVATQTEGATKIALTDLMQDDLPDRDVLVRITHSTLNYKDALAVSGRGNIIRNFPMVCGIDFAGVVEASRHPDWQPGDRVLANGFGMSERHWGGYTQFQRVPAQWLIRLPDVFSPVQAMGLGTAGYTAMLCVQTLQDHGVKPQDGRVLVTGASGGVGSVALLVLATLGYRVVGTSGRPAMHNFIRSLGATDIVDRATLDRAPRPLEKETWAACIDSVGSCTLATLLAQTQYEGIVAACGLAGGHDLPATVMPFILRGVTLRGIDSVMALPVRRQRAWDDLARVLHPDKIDQLYTVAPMANIVQLADDLLAGKLSRRVVIDVNNA